MFACLVFIIVYDIIFIVVYPKNDKYSILIIFMEEKCMKYPKTIKLYHFGTWYKAYNDDAKIISFLMDYKLFEDESSGTPTVGFPEISIDKVEINLRNNKVNYILINDGEVLKDFGSKNNYERFLYNDLPLSYLKGTHRVTSSPKGSFVVKYNNDPEEEFVISENGINENAELVKKVISHDLGENFDINGNTVTLLKKDIYF